MSSLKEQLIKLGSTNPELREHIRPVLASLGKSSSKYPSPGSYIAEWEVAFMQALAKNFGVQTLITKVTEIRPQSFTVQVGGQSGKKYTFSSNIRLFVPPHKVILEISIRDENRTEEVTVPFGHTTRPSQFAHDLGKAFFELVKE